MAQQYAGRGFADVSVEGKTFNILLGSDDAEVAQWRAQRRARWPSRARLAQDAAAEKERNAQPAGLAALMSYASDDDSDAAEPPPKKQRPQKPCLVMLHSGRCRRGDECAYAHDVDNVPTCRFFREPGGCRRGRGVQARAPGGPPGARAGRARVPARALTAPRRRGGDGPGAAVPHGPAGRDGVTPRRRGDGDGVPVV